MAQSLDSFKTRKELKVGSKTYSIFGLEALKFPVSSLPFSLKIVLENLLRNEDGQSVKKEDVEQVASGKGTGHEIFFMPARVLMQDFTGVPAVVDLAAMRDAMKALGGDPSRINPLIPVDLVIDHSVQVDQYGAASSFAFNSEIEFERNKERYQFLKWGQKAFKNFRAVPPETGIVHQVNLENLATVVFVNGRGEAYPDSLVGTDSHTTMINGLGVAGWGVGGIEAEAAMLGQSLSLLVPEVVGFKLHGKMAQGATATDLVLTVTEMLRKKGVVNKFVEFYGTGLSSLSVADRATIANMCPEYGATVGFFPVDAQTLEFLRMTGRPEETVKLVEAYCKAQGLFRTDATPDPVFTETLELDLAKVEPSMAGPKRPQDRLSLPKVKSTWPKALVDFGGAPAQAGGTAVATAAKVTIHGTQVELDHGSVVIAAITSCTNTSNPSVMIGAGLLAKKAVEAGLSSKAWVKTSLAPGSKVVMDYLQDAGLTPYLEKLGFYLVGYGCTTCIGNSGPLPQSVAEAVDKNKLVVAAVLSGNRNFEGRVHPQVKAAYLASPPLVVAYALAGRVDLDLSAEPLGQGTGGRPVYLKDIWPTQDEVNAAVAKHLRQDMFEKAYGADFLKGDERWQSLEAPKGELFAWDPKSTYVRKPPYFEKLSLTPKPIQDIRGARALALLGDSVTTDHISPAGNIKAAGPAGKYLQEHGVAQKDFNSYGARRGNHEVMVRGTFANIRLRNKLAPGTEGGVTMKDGAQLSIFEASEKFIKEGTPLVVLAGKEYGSGSSRDWAAKGPALLGVKAAIAESYERIHRSNLVGMGVLPLELKKGDTFESLGLTGRETFDITGLAGDLKPRGEATVEASLDGKAKTFQVRVRIDTPIEVEYYRYGGILPFVLCQMVKGKN